MKINKNSRNMISIDIILTNIIYLIYFRILCNQNIVVQFIALFIKILVQFQKQINIRSEYLKI